MLKNFIHNISKLTYTNKNASFPLIYSSAYYFSIKPGPFITSVDGMPKKKRSSKKKSQNSLEENSEVIDSPKVLFSKGKSEPKSSEPVPETVLYAEELGEQENKSQGKSIFVMKSELSGAKLREIQDIQNYKNLIEFLQMPQNMTLNLSERHLLFDRMTKILSLQSIEKVLEANLHITSFLEKYELALKASEDINHCISIFNSNQPKSMQIAYEPFFTNCLDLILNHPKRVSKNLINIISNILKFYISINVKDRQQEQIKIILQGMEQAIETCNIQTKMIILRLMRQSKVYNPKILDYMLNYSELNFDMMNYEDLFDIMWTVFQERSMNPYELFYKMRIKFNENYKTLKPFTVIRTLGIYCKLKMHFMETMYENIFKVLADDKVINDSNHIDALLVLNYYSKIKFKDEKIFTSYLTKVKANLKKYSEQHLKILLLTLADSNYQEKEIFMDIYKFYNLLQLIGDIEKEETLSEFEKQYFQAVCDYILSKDQPKETPQLQAQTA